MMMLVILAYIDLVQWLWDEFRVSLSETTVGRELRALGFRKLSARPRHYAQDPEAAEAFKKVSRSAWSRSGTPIRASVLSSGIRMKQGSGRRTS